MKPSRRLSRRSFVACVVGAAVAGTFVGAARGQNIRYSGVNDCDNGRDRPGYGTGVRNQYTDTDIGPNRDPVCRGRGSAIVSGQGEYNERSQGTSLCTDRDIGPGSDPEGRGQRCGNLSPYPRRQTPTRRRVCTDRDVGPNRDPYRRGRHC